MQGAVSCLLLAFTSLCVLQAYAEELVAAFVDASHPPEHWKGLADMVTYIRWTFLLDALLQRTISSHPDICDQWLVNVPAPGSEAAHATANKLNATNVPQQACVNKLWSEVPLGDTR